ncbi:MAG: hypothetical protein KAY37_11735 [Phycisphaerae bacterium]|nr:hypothetical protein [Phycisphaerae bacterium]
MKHGLWNVIITVAAVVVAGTAWADEPDWETMPYTTHAAYQAVDADGFGTFPTTDPIKMRGVIINKPEEMLDGTPSAPAFLGGQWQIYVQTGDEGDFGGTACWMGQLYGNLPWVPPDQSYTDEEWLAELDRLNHDPASGHEFRPGDLVELRARAPGLHYAGKSNINEQHSKNPTLDFDVLLLEADYGLPTPMLLSLSHLKDVNDEFIFDPTRATGCEHYQSTLVRLNNVTFIDTADWGPEADLELTDGLLTFPVRLGLGAGFTDYGPPSGAFDIIAILDQEDDNDADGYKHGYRLWVLNYTGNDCILPEPFPLLGDANCDGQVSWRDIDPFVAALGGQTQYEDQFPCCLWLNADINEDGDVTWRDIDPFVEVLCSDYE